MRVLYCSLCKFLIPLLSNTMSKHCLIVGGGIIGISTAYYLRKSGWDVTIVDRNTIGSQCSHGNCGLVSPSHVLPLAMPGAIGDTVKLMMQENSPFYIKPRFDPKLWAWLTRFALRCRHKPMVESGWARHNLLRSSRELYDTLVHDEGVECEFESQGCLFVYQTQKKLDDFVEENELTCREFGISAERWDRDRLVHEEPAIRSDVAGAWYYETDAHMRPDRLVASWRALLENLDVTICENCNVESFRRAGGRGIGINTSQGPMFADHFVVSTGAFTPFLNQQLGCDIPIQPGKGYSVTMPRPARCPRIPMLCPEHKVAITPMQTGYRLGSTMEFSGYDASLNRKRLDALREGASHYLHEPACEPIQEEWFGWRPMTYDGKAIIDRCPIMSNVHIAAGHNMLGLSMAPATGKLVQELVNGDEPHIDPRPYSLARFE